MRARSARAQGEALTESENVEADLEIIVSPIDRAGFGEKGRLAVVAEQPAGEYVLGVVNVRADLDALLDVDVA